MSMKPRRFSFSPANFDRDGICAAQQLVGAGDLTINGALASGGAVSFAIPYAIDIYSGGNLSTLTFTITGTDQYGRALSATVTGPNAGASTSTVYFKTVTQIAVDGAVGSDVEVGAADEFAYEYALDVYLPDTTVAIDISGTINYTLQKAYERPTAGETPNWVAGGLATQTADNATAYTSPTGAVRIKVNSYSNGATLAMTVAQARVL